MNILIKSASNVCAVAHTLARGFPLDPLLGNLCYATNFLTSKSSVALFVKRSAAKIKNYFSIL